MSIEAVATPGIILSVRLRDDRTAIAQMASSLTFLVGTVCLVALDLGLFSFALLFVVHVLVKALLCMHFARPLRRPRAEGEYSAWFLGRQALPVIVITLITVAHLQLDVAIVSHVLGPAGAAILVASSSLAYMPMLLLGALTESMMPVLAAGSPHRAVRFTLCMIRLSALLGLLVTVGCAVAAPYAANLFGPGFEDVAVILPILGLRVALYCISGPFGTCLIATQRQNLYMWCTIVVTSGALAACWIVTPIYGIRGAAWAAVLSEIPKGLLLASLAFRKTE
jgi:PST family polysaccharide transporter